MLNPQTALHLRHCAMTDFLHRADLDEVQTFANAARWPIEPVEGEDAHLVTITVVQAGVHHGPRSRHGKGQVEYAAKIDSYGRVTWQDEFPLSRSEKLRLDYEAQKEGKRD